MSKFLDSRFNKISYLTPLSFFILYHPKTHFSGVESEGRFRRVASYVLVSKNACPSGISDGPDGPKFDVRARGFPLALPPPRRRAGVLPLPVLASLRSGWSSPSRWAGSGCVSVKVRFARPRNPRHARPAGVRGSGCSGRPLTLPHPSKRAYGPLRASWIRSSGLPGPQGTE